VRDFVELSFRYCGFEVVWAVKGEQEKGYDTKTNKLLVAVDPLVIQLEPDKSLAGTRM
jgi:GDPmannose 4,6-dehydratase